MSERIEYVEIHHLHLVPLGNGFIDRNRDAPDAAIIPHAIAMMKTEVQAAEKYAAFSIFFGKAL